MTKSGLDSEAQRRRCWALRRWRRYPCAAPLEQRRRNPRRLRRSPCTSSTPVIRARREKDFAEFLGKYFTQVQTGDLATFGDRSADGFDVAILDYDGDGMDAFHAPRPKLSQNYTHATVTVGVIGGLLGSQLRLKTGYE